VEQHSFETEFEKLNDRQREAICHIEGPLLVIAGAGSGKTRVATMRVAHLVRSGIPAPSIVAVTFTNKAAREMRERVDILIGSSAHVSTFHSLGAKILRESIAALSYPANFAIYAEEESRKVIKDCLKERGLAAKEADVASFGKAISNIKNNPACLEHHSHLTQSIFEQYQQRLKQSGAADFDDLIYLPLKLFREYPEILQRYNERWRYLLVDEYQDTSDSQSQFAAALAGVSKNIFAVGDPDQSIYSWRGARVENILSFKEQYPNARIVNLEQNYRSTNTILEASNAVIKHNRGRVDKSLWSQKGKGDPIVRHIASTERQEAEYVTESIFELMQAGYTQDQIAVLYRTNAQSRSIEDRFIESRIPYTIWGGIPFYARKEIRDVLSFLQIAVLPQDMVSFERAIKTIGQGGIGEVTLAKIRQQAIDQNIPILDLATFGTQESLGLTKKQSASLSHFCKFIASLREQIHEGTALSMISHAINESGYISQLEKDEETLDDRKENLEQLLARAQEWDETHPDDPPTLFLEELMLEGHGASSKNDGVKITLATIHNAKGLEFPVVFILGLEEDLFPHINAKMNDEGIEEERRLFYVGMTRAKERLFISASMSRFLFGGLRSTRVSRFFKEIPVHFSKPYKKSIQYIDKTPSKADVQPVSPFNVGQLVLHPEFGVGRIENCKMTSVGLAYEVLFSNDQTLRKIIAAYSPMRSIQG
jgi:DNA helicase II / ATP-dependent DNA helicase PcrA